MSEPKIEWVKQENALFPRYKCSLGGHEALIGVARDVRGRRNGYYFEIDGRYQGDAPTVELAKQKATRALLDRGRAETVTPGPWQVGRATPPPCLSITGPDDTIVASLYSGMANARLIAAARELLAACEAVLADLHYDGADGFWRAGPWADPSTEDGKGGTVEMLRAAVARARGK